MGLQTLFGIFWDFEFLTNFWCREGQEIDFLNSQGLLICDATKFVPTRTFSSWYMENRENKVCSPKVKKNSTPDHFLGLKIGTHIGLVTLHNCKDQIFDFWFILVFLAFFGVKKADLGIFFDL